MGEQPRLPCDTPLSTKVGTEIHRKVTVSQSVEFARGLRATGLFLFVWYLCYLPVDSYHQHQPEADVPHSLLVQPRILLHY
jgi:hypothetical protein